MALPQGLRPQKNTWGGISTVSNFSGAASGAAGRVAFTGPGDYLIQSGQGRLDYLLYHQPMQSGLAVFFYDSAVATSGGPFPLSGHTIIGAIPQTYQFPNGVLPVSGQFSTAVGSYAAGLPLQMCIPFLSGMCVNIKSGQPGFTVNWSPEPQVQF